MSSSKAILDLETVYSNQVDFSRFGRIATDATL
jgi:hypothetical protein